MSKRFWGEAVMMDVYILNRLPTRSIEGKTPYQFWHGKKPSVYHLRVFGSITYMKITRPHLVKLDNMGVKTVFIGYEPGSKAYRRLMIGFTCLMTSFSTRTRSRAGTVMTPRCQVVNHSWWSTSSLSRAKEELLTMLHHHLLQAQHRLQCPHHEHLLQLKPCHQHRHHHRPSNQWSS
jgi:hypothetical protein